MEHQVRIGEQEGTEKMGKISDARRGWLTPAKLENKQGGGGANEEGERSKRGRAVLLPKGI